MDDPSRVPWDFATQLQTVNERLVLSLLRHQERLDEADRELRARAALLDSIDVGVLELDRDGSCTAINRAAGEILGCNPGLALGLLVSALLDPCADGHADVPIDGCPLLCACRAGSLLVVTDGTLRRQDGDVLRAAYSLHPVMQGSVVTGAVLVFADIGERRRTERELYAAELQAAQLEGATAAVRELTHLLNNDLARAIGYLDLLENDPGVTASMKETIQGAAEALVVAAGHMHRFQRLSRVALYESPVGPALDLEQSIGESAAGS